jgi:hypothetical protein
VSDDKRVPTGLQEHLRRLNEVLNIPEMRRWAEEWRRANERLNTPEPRRWLEELQRANERLNEQMRPGRARESEATARKVAESNTNKLVTSEAPNTVTVEGQRRRRSGGGRPEALSADRVERLQHGYRKLFADDSDIQDQTAYGRMLVLAPMDMQGATFSTFVRHIASPIRGPRRKSKRQN